MALPKEKPASVRETSQNQPREIVKFAIGMQVTKQVLRFITESFPLSKKEVADLEWLYKRAIKIPGLISVYRDGWRQHPYELHFLWQEILSLSSDLYITVCAMKRQAKNGRRNQVDAMVYPTLLPDEDFQMAEELKFYAEYQLQRLGGYQAKPRLMQ